jgi:ubiquinol-cytochrome c reductase cytochrome b subunit
MFAAKAGGFFFLVFGVTMLIASLVTINPIWSYGPYDPSPVSAGTQPDWYIGFADGMLRLIPSGWEFEFLGGTLSLNLIIPIVVLMVFLGLVAFYPFFEAWVTGDKREHHIAERPRNAPTRTAIGAAGVTFYAVLWAAASSDLIATHFWTTIEGVILTLQILLIVGPFIAFGSWYRSTSMSLPCCDPTIADVSRLPLEQKPASLGSTLRTASRPSPSPNLNRHRSTNTDNT